MERRLTNGWSTSTYATWGSCGTRRFLCGYGLITTIVSEPPGPRPSPHLTYTTAPVRHERSAPPKPGHGIHVEDMRFRSLGGGNRRGTRRRRASGHDDPPSSRPASTPGQRGPGPRAWGIFAARVDRGARRRQQQTTTRRVRHRSVCRGDGGDDHRLQRSQGGFREISMAPWSWTCWPPSRSCAVTRWSTGTESATGDRAWGASMV